MVAKIISGKNMRGVLTYNENKVEKGQASLFMASGFAGEVNTMNFNQKLQRFTLRNMLNPSVKTNTLHITLNFHHTDKIDSQNLQDIVSEYMEKIGFSEQPYLVYLHQDTHHPHVHVATTNIKSDGKRIDIHGIGYRLSEPARKEIEKKFSLVVAEGRGNELQPMIKPIKYGEVPTKKSISDIVSAVVKTYSFGSFNEFNAVLGSFNIYAGRGSEDAAMYKAGGLVYSALDEEGNKIGVPIKASSIYSRPILSRVEKRYIKNVAIRKEFRDAVKAKIDRVMNNSNQLLTHLSFAKQLKATGIDTVFATNESGRVFGITFIDHATRSVFKGSELGKGYAANKLMNQFQVPHDSHLATKMLLNTYDDKSSSMMPAEEISYLNKINKSAFLESFLSKTDQIIHGDQQKKKRRKKYRGL